MVQLLRFEEILCCLLWNLLLLLYNLLLSPVKKVLPINDLCFRSFVRMFGFFSIEFH